MKLKIQFGPEIRFDHTVWRLTRTPAQWSRDIRDLWRALAMAERSKPIRPGSAAGMFSEDANPK